MIKAMTIRSLSPPTRRRYLSAVSKFIGRRGNSHAHRMDAPIIAWGGQDRERTARTPIVSALTISGH
jgi:hypothetical protein